MVSSAFTREGPSMSRRIKKMDASNMTVKEVEDLLRKLDPTMGNMGWLPPRIFIVPAIVFGTAFILMLVLLRMAS